MWKRPAKRFADVYRFCACRDNHRRWIRKLVRSTFATHRRDFASPDRFGDSSSLCPSDRSSTRGYRPFLTRRLFNGYVRAPFTHVSSARIRACAPTVFLLRSCLAFRTFRTGITRARARPVCACCFHFTISPQTTTVVARKHNARNKRTKKKK